MKRVSKKFFAALLALALCAIGTVAWADVKIDAANFPDEKFRQWLKENAAGGGDVLTDAQIAAAKEVDVSETSGVGGISSLKGLEHFTALNRLDCSGNKLKELDVSKNGALVYLNCDGSELTKLDVSKNRALEYLKCKDNKLTALDLSHNPELGELACGGNKLTALDLSHNPALGEVDCGGNELTELDVSKNGDLETLDCSGNKLAKLDLSHNPALDRLHCEGNGLTKLNLSKNAALSFVSLPATPEVALPNGDKIAPGDLQIGKAGGRYRLDISKYADKIEEVLVYVEGDLAPVTASDGVYAFDPCEGACTISYKLGEREGEEWVLDLRLDVEKF